MKFLINVKFLDKVALEEVEDGEHGGFQPSRIPRIAETSVSQEEHGIKHHPANLPPSHKIA